MLKTTKFISIFLLSLLLTACGFKKINQDNQNLIYLEKINISGDKKISYLLKNNILLISNKSSVNKYEVTIDVKKLTKDKIKNSAGKITRYNISVIASLSIENTKNKVIIDRTFNSNRDYDVAVNHSDTKQNEKNALKNITQKLSEDINNFIILSVKN